MPNVPDIEDMERIKREIIQAFREDLSIIKRNEERDPDRWLRGSDVKKLLGGISESTLYDMRVKGFLKGSRIMGTWYYRYSDIQQMMKNYEVGP